jgi:uncharacterized protein (TIGR02145 family)
LRPRAKFSVAASVLALLGLVLLSCDTTSSTNASNIVSGRWAMDSIRMPDSATWTVHANAGTFSLSFPTDTSFSVTDTLPAPLGTDTLVIQAWTLSLRTTIANCWSDKAGNLTLYLPTTKDSLAIHLLLKLDSLRHRNAATWGSRKDSRPTQIASLIRAYAALILATDTTFSRFPARHPVGIDTAGVIDQLLIQAAATPMTAATLLQQLGALDTAKVHARARTLALAGQVDSLILYPVISTSLVLSGVPTDLELVEDSLTAIPIAVSGLNGGSATLHVVSSDTSILASFQRTVLTQDTLRLQAKPNSHGGPFKVNLTLSVGTTNSVTTVVFATVASRNDAPTFAGASSLLVASNAIAKSFAGWIDSISPGPADESGQKVSFAVPVVSGASLFSVAPSVDASGTLAFTGKSNSSGTAKIRVRAKDDGDSTGGNVDSSAWKETSITFDVAPVLTLPAHAASTWEGIAVKAGSATISDFETGTDNLALTWTVSDSTLLPHDSLYVGASGSSRNIEIHPAAHKWGTCRVTFTLTDSQGVSVADTIAVTVLPVNHAPILTLKSPTLLATTWKDEQTFALATATWDDVATQSGRFDLALSNSADTAYFKTLRMDSTGVLHVLAKMDTAVAVNFLIRAHDSAGTAHGGVDTGAWSGTLTIHLVDTVLDADGNSYRARTMPDGKVWMRSNLRTSADSCGGGFLSNSADCVKYGGLYKWSVAIAVDSACDTSATCMSSIKLPHQGLCPSNWHIASKSEWSSLFVATVGAAGSDSSYNLRSTDTSDNSWSVYNDMPYYHYPGSGKYGDFLIPTVLAGTFSAMRAASGACYWLPSNSSIASWPGFLGFYANSVVEAPQGRQPDRESIRCIAN